MGVAGLATWLRRRHPEAFAPLPAEAAIDHVYIDMASTLHTVMRKARTRSYFHSLLHRRLDELLAMAAPRQSVVLALDGPAPLAKLLEQRRRRRKEAGRASRQDVTTTRRQRSVMMLEVHASLSAYICKRLADPATRHLRFELRHVDSTVKGEGELKILSRLLGHGSAGQQEESSEGGPAAQRETHLIVGGDSDLLLMAMVAGRRGVYVFSEREEVESDGFLAARLSGGAPRPVVFSRDALEASWRQQHLRQADSGQEVVVSLALDLMLLSVMCSGNDYLPAVQGMQLSNKNRPGIWDLYLQQRRSPDWRGQQLVQLSSASGGGSSGRSGASASSSGEGGGSSGGSQGRLAVRLNAPMLLQLLQRYSDQRNAMQEGLAGASWEDPATLVGDAAGGGGAARRKLYRSVPPSWGLPADLVEYFKGLEWVLHMYCSGAVQDYRWTYDPLSPSLAQLMTHLEADAGLQQAQQAEGQAEQQLAGSGSGEGVDAAAPHATALQVQPLLPVACAMALLPRGGRRHAATALRHLMDEPSPVSEIYAVCEECSDLAKRISEVGKEFEVVKNELGRLQAGLAGSTVLDREGPASAIAGVADASARCEEAQERLKELLADLSRSQQAHVTQMHPYRPFPTAALEAAVAAVPLHAYPRRERRLARFGREFVYSYTSGQEGGQLAPAQQQQQREEEEEEAAAREEVHEEEEEGEQRLPMRGHGRLHFQPWMAETLSFAAAFPRVADPILLRRSAGRLRRELLPLRPYMQAPLTAAGSSALVPPLARSQFTHLRHYSGVCGLGSAKRASGIAAAGGGLQGALLQGCGRWWTRLRALRL